jgi:cytochrome c556
VLVYAYDPANGNTGLDRTMFLVPSDQRSAGAPVSGYSLRAMTRPRSAARADELRTTLRVFLLASALVSLGACTREQSLAPEAVATAELLPSAAETLDRMDTRTPVPMASAMANHQKENMRDHLLAVQEIVAALASDDFGAVERAAARIGFTEQREQMCTHMGAAAPGFTEQALAFHHAADRIAVAARDRDRGRVLGELGATLETCTSCHSAWKQEIVDEVTWRRLTAGGSTADGAKH